MSATQTHSVSTRLLRNIDAVTPEQWDDLVKASGRELGPDEWADINQVAQRIVGSNNTDLFTARQAADWIAANKAQPFRIAGDITTMMVSGQKTAMYSTGGALGGAGAGALIGAAATSWSGPGALIGAGIGGVIGGIGGFFFGSSQATTAYTTDRRDIE